MEAGQLGSNGSRSFSAGSMQQQQQQQDGQQQSPLQIFGQYAQDGSLLTPSLPGPIFSEDPLSWVYEDALDPSDPKRRRIARACDMCRKKKIKCDAKSPKCSHCQNYQTECVFTHVEKKRSPPKGAKYIEGLENRLGRMEHLLRMSGLLTEQDAGATDLSVLEERLARQRNSSNHSSPAPTITTTAPATAATTTATTAAAAASASASASPSQQQAQSKSGLGTNSASSPVAPTSPSASQFEEASKQDASNSPADLADMMCSLMTNNQGETRYIGSSSSFSIFSPRGIQWVNQKTGDTSFHGMIASVSADDNKWYHWKPEVFSDIFVRRTFKALPPRDECISLLIEFFESFNKMIPLFHEPTFMHLVDRQYSDDPYEGSGWWASLNVALAIAYRMRAMRNQNLGTEEARGWMYLKNSLAVLSELILRNTDLLSVQALLGMSLFLQGTPNPQPSFILVASAVRLAHNIGLHKRGSFFGLNEAEIEQRKRVFWIGYLLDKDICLRSGRPPIQDDDDWNVELPSESPEDDVGNIPLSDGKGKVNLFRLQCRFAIIAAKVYNQLYSTKASKQSDGELLNTIGELDRELEEWKDSIPLEFRPEHEIQAVHPALILQLVVLHFAYYNCLTTIHRMSVHHGYWSDRLTEYARAGRNLTPLNPRVFSSAALCVSAARASIHLIKYIPLSDFACVWLILYFPVSSLVTLFANILQNPQDVRARGDLKLMNVVVSFLSQIFREESSGGIGRMLAVCSEFERIANVVLEKAEKDMTTRQKRKQGREREKLEKQGGAFGGAATRPELNTTGTIGAADNLASSPAAAAAATAATPEAPAAGASTIESPRTLLNNFGPADFPNFSRSQGLEAVMDEYMMSAQQGSGGLMPFASDGWPGSQRMGGNGNGNGNGNASTMTTPSTPNGAATGFGDATGTGAYRGGDATAPFNFGSFQQPFVPQDMWSMPMTFEWDWNEMMNLSGNGMGGAIGGGGGGMAMDEHMNGAAQYHNHNHQQHNQRHDG